MQQHFSATSQDKSDFIVKFLHLQKENNNKIFFKKYTQQRGGGKNPKARNFCFCKDSVDGAIPFEIIPP